MTLQILHININHYLYCFIFLIFLSCEKKVPKVIYVCPPCNLPCDTLYFSESGICPHCKMTLIPKEELVLNEIRLQEGSGVFLIEGGVKNKDKHIKVYYHRPQNFNSDSKILIVVPGAGRNADSYRDAWIESSEKYGVLIISPMHAESDYAFEDYHLGGLIKEVNFENSIEFVENSNIAKLNEDNFTFQINNDSTGWIFTDFDRIFDLIVNATDSKQINYDIFGHSAGGQILHRLAIFYPTSKANKIVAANAGFYTLPDFEIEMPFGVKNTFIKKKDLMISFSKNLTLLLGELDNENEKGGTLLRSITVDQQGLHRLERGEFFFEKAQNLAKELESPFNWKIEIVNNVGHNHKKMGVYAAQHLFHSLDNN